MCKYPILMLYVKCVGIPQSTILQYLERKWLIWQFTFVQQEDMKGIVVHFMIDILPIVLFYIIYIVNKRNAFFTSFDIWRRFRLHLFLKEQLRVSGAISFEAKEYNLMPLVLNVPDEERYKWIYLGCLVAVITYAFHDKMTVIPFTIVTVKQYIYI